jgi:predicted DNA-binding protein (UPF0251 family)
VVGRLDVLSALATLPPKAQEALRLTAWEHLDVEAAARVAGCSATAFKVRPHRAPRRLAGALAEQAEPRGLVAPAGRQRLPVTSVMAARAAEMRKGK